MAGGWVIGLTVLGFLLARQTAGESVWNDFAIRLLLGIVTGVNLVHFWIDAFIWKLSDPAMRRMHPSFLSRPA